MKQRIVQMITAGFILLFLYTAFSKLSALPAFRQVISESQYLQRHAGWIAWVLPILNLVAAALLLTPRTRRYGRWLSLALLVVFTSHIGWMLIGPSPLPCSCGGITNHLSWTQHFFLNTGLIGLLVFGVKNSR